MQLHSQKDKETIREILSQGVGGEFWTIICQALDETAEHLKKIMENEDMEDLPADQYKVKNEILKAKKANIEKLKNLPMSICEWLDDIAQEKKDFDPYFTASDFDNVKK